MTVAYKRIRHIIERQYEAEQAFLDEFSNGDYDLQHPLIKLNPYLICPLSAVILFYTPISCEVTIIVRGKEAAGDIHHTFPEAQAHILPIYGLYGGYKNRIDIVLSTGESHQITIQTEPLIADVHEATSIQTSANYMGENMMFLTASMDCKSAAYDYRGDVRWYTNEFLNFDMKRMPNGHILVGTERLLKMPYYTSGLYEMSLSGKIYKEYVSNMGGYHHDQFVMPDGNILMCTSDAYAKTVEDIVVLLDKDTGEVLKKWDLKNILPQYPIAGSGSQDEKDWFHNNAVWYDEKTNTLTLSGRHQDAVINIDYETGKLNWIIGDATNWPEAYQKYFFKPVGDLDNFDWQYEQHGSIVLPDGDIMLFDNGHFRSKNQEEYLKNSENFSRGVRYRINTDEMEIQQIWQFGKERGGEFFSPYICNVAYYNEGHYLIHSGGVGYMDGKTCDGFACVDMLNPGDHIYTLDSVTCELMDDVLLYEMHVPANFYRARKLPLYYANEVIELGKGKILNQLAETKPTRIKIKADETGEIIPDEYRIHITEEDDRLLINGYYEEGIVAQILLQSAEEIRRYEIPTHPENFGAMCVGSFQKADRKEVDVYINKTGLHGSYRLKILLQVDENEYKIYETNITIFC